MLNNPAIIAPNFGAPLVFSGLARAPAARRAHGGRPTTIPAELYSSAFADNDCSRAYEVVPPAPISGTMVEGNGRSLASC